MGTPNGHPSARLGKSVYLAACRCEPVARTPVWFQRQAGRSLPEYHEVRGDGSILTAIKQPEVAAEITLQPVRRYGVDAAILFSDIVVPAHAVGFGIDVEPGVGPVAQTPFSTAADLERLPPLEPTADVPYVIETVELLAEKLDVPLIGFAGAPFTLASYLICGRPSRDHAAAKTLMRSEPQLWEQLCDRLADHAISFLRALVDAGASAVQLFDSWAGSLSRAEYEQFVAPHTKRGIRRAGRPRGAPRSLRRWHR